MTARRSRVIVAALFAALSAAPRAGAQPGTPVPLLKLQLESGADLGPGAIAVAEGVATPTGVRFALDGLDVSQPISVAVASTDPSQPLTLNIAKDDFGDPQRSATTTNGTATLEFRTHGAFGISVASQGPSVPFLVAVWAGPQQPPETPTFLAPVKNYDAGTLAALKSSASATGAPPPPPSSPGESSDRASVDGGALTGGTWNPATMWLLVIGVVVIGNGSVLFWFLRRRAEARS
jgi:hypothetical protein